MSNAAGKDEPRDLGVGGKQSFPAYLPLAESGELKERARGAVESLACCRGCPRGCGADRLRGRKGRCGVGCQAIVASAGPHFGEEDCLRGTCGSGTIFFSGCNLGCVFCQNWEISHEREGRQVSAEQLARMMLRLQDLGCHNINWVTPSHVVPQALQALALAAERGLRLPIVYNSGGYDSLETLRLLEGVVDIYMPDFKVWQPRTAERLLQASDYPAVARAALREMHRQTGPLTFDQHRLARRGVLVRHLVLPHRLADTGAIARWLAAEVSSETYVNVMAQYHPAGDLLSPAGLPRFADLARPVTSEEIREAIGAARSAGLSRFDHRGS